MLYMIVEWLLSICSYVLFALAELWLWITIIEADDQDVSEEILDQLAELVERNAQHFQGPGAVPLASKKVAEEPISSRTSLRRASRQGLSDMRANIAHSGRSKLAMVRTLQRDVMVQMSAYTNASRPGTKASSRVADSPAKQEGSTRSSLKQASKRRLKWRQAADTLVDDAAGEGGQHNEEGQDDKEGQQAAPWPDDAQPTAQNIALEVAAEAVDAVDTSQPSLTATSPFVEVVKADAAGARASSADDAPDALGVPAVQPRSALKSTSLHGSNRRKKKHPEASQVSFADVPSHVEHSSSLRRRWLRRDTRSTGSESDEPSSAGEGSPTLQEAREGEAGDAPRHGVVEYVIRPVYRGVFRPIGKRVQLLVGTQPEEAQPRKKQRFLSRRFLSAYGAWDQSVRSAGFLTAFWCVCMLEYKMRKWCLFLACTTFLFAVLVVPHVARSARVMPTMTAGAGSQLQVVALADLQQRMVT